MRSVDRVLAISDIHGENRKFLTSLDIIQIEYYTKVIKARITMPPKGMGILPERSVKLIREYVGGIL